MTALSALGPVWLDVTRTVSRVGRGPLTGIDRVERAYLDAVLETGGHFLLRSTRGYLLLDQVGGARLRHLSDHPGELGRADWISRLMGRGEVRRHRVEAALRPLAIDRALPKRFGALLARHPSPSVFFNVGHSNLSHRVLRAFDATPQTKAAVLLHDVIPLTHPDLCREGQPARFAAAFEAVETYADLVLTGAAATRDEIAAQWRGANPPRLHIAPLGVEPVARSPAQHNETPAQFVMLGTVEPRKNHALMLDVWEDLAGDPTLSPMPELHIIGQEGWRSERVMARLRGHPLLGKTVFWHPNLTDSEVAERLGNATALLFPSKVEGFGYPPFEALAAKTLPICSDLTVLRENLGNHAVYVRDSTAYAWGETVRKHLNGTLHVKPDVPMHFPNWAEHFESVGQALIRV